MHPLEAAELTYRFFAGLAGEARLLDLESVLVELLGAGIDLAELVLDRAELLTE